MKLNIDILELCRKLKTAGQPPYMCPVQDCCREYKSMMGLQYHLMNFDHDKSAPDDMGSVDGGDQTPKSAKIRTPRSGRRGKKKNRFTKIRNNPKKKKITPLESTREPLTLAESQRIVEYELEDQVCRLAIKQILPMLSQSDYVVMCPKATKSGPSQSALELAKSKDLISKLPEASFTEVESYNIRPAPPRPIGYIRFIEKSPDDLDNEVEYDIDEEDAAWLEVINKKRTDQGLAPVTVDTFELLMDRLEKESYFQGGEPYTVIDDDAICCICMDGECQNSNVILFCDMCNLAVHQDCYGVPYIPESQWLCRRCLHSPSRAVDCVLCPNTGGAFKQTDRGHWAHVVCALWIPEVRFANTVFLEPIDSIETIPPARWKLTCYICKQKGVGACIQCYKSNCYAAFHVTCAQHAGLFMKMDAVSNGDGDDSNVTVQKIAYCNSHTPPDVECIPKLTLPPSPRKQGKPAPIISVPIIPPDKIPEIGLTVNIPKKNQFIQRLIAYWTMKRQLRNGVPLLRRLQPTHVSRKDSISSDEHNDLEQLRRQFKNWQSLRQDLERARLLCELVRKREKLKKELVSVKANCMELELMPLAPFLRKLLDMLRARDTGEIFLEPVDPEEVPDYRDVVKHPMDLSTMRDKVNQFEYQSLSDFKADFDLMITNCLTYNSKETVFYRAGIKMKEQGGALIKQALIDLEVLGIQQPSPRRRAVSENQTEVSAMEIDIKAESVKNNPNLSPEDKITILEELVELCNKLKNGVARNKRLKFLKGVIGSFKRKRTFEEMKEKEEDEEEEEEVEEKPAKRRTRGADKDKEDTKRVKKEDLKEETSPSSTTQGKSPSDSKTPPQGVNRRTAVLFTRKAAVALRSSATPPTPTPTSPTPQARRRGRSKTDTPANNNTSSLASDSFRAYRGDAKAEDSGSDDGDSSCSECDSSAASVCSSSPQGSRWSESEDEEPEGHDATPREALEQLQMVWAKCRGYPWYPALIINPMMPKGYTHNGVPIPTPPEDVLALATNYTEPVYLVLFFDTKRTWQWLPRTKLEALGTPELDQMKLTESRKPADRKAVKKAFQEAMDYKKLLENGPDPDQPAASVLTTAE